MPAHPAPEKPTRRRVRNALYIVVALAVVYGLVAGLAAPPLARKAIADKLGEKLGRVVTLDDLSFNPYTLNATAKGLRILEPDKSTVFASFDRLDVDGSVSSLYHLAPVADEVTLGGLRVNLVRDGDTHYNVSDILGRFASEQQKAPADAKPARFSLGNIRLVGARVDFDDRPKGKKHQVSDINVAIPYLSNLPRDLKDYVQPSFAARVNGAPLHIKGETLPFEKSLRTHIALDLDAFEIQPYVGYSPTPLPVRVDGGKLDARVSVRFTQAAGKDPSIDIAGKLGLRDLRLSTPEGGALAQVGRIEADIASFDPLAGLLRVEALRVADANALEGQVRVPVAEARDIRAELAKKTVEIASITSNDGAVELKRGRDGAIELPRLAGADEAQPAASTPWSAAVAKLTLAGYRIALADAAVKPAMTHRVTLAGLEVSDFSTRKGSRATLHARLGLEKGGSVEVESTAALDPLDLEAKIDAHRIDLVALRPYVTQFRTVALKSGQASAKGTLAVKGEGNAMRISYTGSAEVARIATVETTGREDLVNWDSVRMTGVGFRWSHDDPLELAVRDVAVSKAYARVVVTPEGKINLTQLKFATPDEPAASAPAAGAAGTTEAKPRNVRIDRIAFADSRLDFTDHFIKPNYSADVGALHGTVTNLSSDPASRGVVDLQGSYDEASPVTIAGTVNPLSGDLFLDIAAKGKDIELPKLTAYSQRYAGYGITQGKLTLDVKYHVEGGKLQGRNNIRLDQLVFGDKVESPEATKLPVLFAVNLLKDSNGAINVELPISGSLEDPQFEIGGLITQVVVGLLKKAVTSPFSLLTAVVGGGGGGGSGAAGGPSGDDLAFVDFDAGGADLGPASRRKLDAVAKALLDRPAVKLEMAASVDAEKDLHALKRAALQRMLVEAKRATLKAAPQAEVVVAPEERARYLKAILEREGIATEAPAPKEETKDSAKDGKPHQLSAVEMEALALERIEIKPEDLAALAQRRSEQVKGYLVSQGQLPAERVLVATNAEGAPEKAHLSRVDFSLR